MNKQHTLQIILNNKFSIEKPTLEDLNIISKILEIKIASQAIKTPQANISTNLKDINRNSDLHHFTTELEIFKINLKLPNSNKTSEKEYEDILKQYKLNLQGINNKLDELKSPPTRKD